MGFPIIYEHKRIKCKQGSDLSDWRVVSACFCSLKQRRGVVNTTIVFLLVSWAEKENQKKWRMSQRRLSEEKPEDFIITISHSSDGISRIRPRRTCPQKFMSSDQKVVSESSSSQKVSKRVRNATSVLRRPLHDALFDHCFRYWTLVSTSPDVLRNLASTFPMNIWRESPEERRNQFTFLSCFWFRMYTSDHKRESVLSWIKKENIFSKRYVFVPILQWSHWSLLIFCHLGESLGSKTTTPCMLLLDSLHTYGVPPKLEPLIRRLVLDIFEKEGRPERKDMVEKIPVLVPKVPQQRNDKECGIFVLYYINMFLERAPESFSISNGYPYFLKDDWFTEEEIEGFYERLESLGLESSDSEEGLDSSDSEGATIERLVGDTWKPCGK